jgi:IclR family KDG regulon transcriptional repressor
MRNAISYHDTGQIMASAVRSVERAVQILFVLGEGRSELSLTELTARTGLPKPTVLRLLRTLERPGLAKRGDAAGQYRLGPGVLTLAYQYLNGLNLRECALPHMTDLRDACGETVILAVLDGTSVLQVERVESEHTLRTSPSIGKHIPAHCSSLGKVLLAYSNPETVDRIISSHPLDRYTSETVTDAEKLRHQLAKVRAAGVAIGDAEYHPHIRGASAPVFSESGKVVAAVCASGPMQRVTLASLAVLQEQVKVAAERISRDLGYSKTDEMRQPKPHQQLAPKRRRSREHGTDRKDRPR